MMPEESAFAGAPENGLVEDMVEDAVDDAVEDVAEDSAESRDAVEDVTAFEDAAERQEASARPAVLGARDTFPPRAYATRIDALYGPLPISRWAQALLDLTPFARLDGVSLSDAPGELLFRRPFPSRLAHSLGVYYLARQARPRDRALHAAALAHDLGHGPFSHLTEPLMIERLGLDHERRGAIVLRRAFAQARGAAARLLTWLDLDEATALMLGDGSGGRGQLLNGQLDYDNLDNVARFLQAADLGDPTYDPPTLARELRLLPPDAADSDDGVAEPSLALAYDAEAQARAWLSDRRRMYRFLGEGERNLAMRGMLRKAIDLATQVGMIADDFFDMTDAQALRLLGAGSSSGAAMLAEAVACDELYMTAWEALAPESARALAQVFAQSDARLAIEERVAMEAGLLPYEVVLSYVVARGERSLPPLLAPERGRAEPAQSQPAASRAPIGLAAPERRIVLSVTRRLGRDYARRARMAAERALGSLGAVPHAGSDLH